MSLKGKRILFFAAAAYEDLELWYPKIRLEEEGAVTTVAGMGERTYPGKRGYPVTVDTDVDKVDAGAYDALVIPGGFAPDQLRRSEKVLRLTREIYQAGKPVAFIYHAGILHVVFDRADAGGAFALQDLGGDRDPPRVTDESEWLAGLVDLPRQAQDFLGSPELVGSESTGDHERVEIGGVYLINARVHRDRVAALSLICAFTHARDGGGRPFFF